MAHLDSKDNIPGLGSNSADCQKFIITSIPINYFLLRSSFLFCVAIEIKKEMMLKVAQYFTNRGRFWIKCKGKDEKLGKIDESS